MWLQTIKKVLSYPKYSFIKNVYKRFSLSGEETMW